MEFYFLIFIFVLGTIIGSFLNVVSLRYNTGLSIYSGRSRCPVCNTELKWYELFPILSFFFQKGECRTCKNKISLQYPVVEFLAGLIFIGVYLRQVSLWNLYSTFDHGFLYSVLFFIFYSLIFSLLLVIVIYDIRHKIIPDFFVYAFIVLSVAKLLLFIYCNGFSLTTMMKLDILTPFFLSLPVVLLWVVSSGRWIGFGDAKLFFGVGALLGFVSGVSAFVLSFWIGAVWSVLAMIISKLKKGETMDFKAEVPFAPFIILATFLVFMFHFDFFRIKDLFNILQ